MTRKKERRQHRTSSTMASLLLRVRVVPMVMMMMTATKATVVNATTVVSVTAIDDPIMQNQQPSRRFLRPWEENEQEQEQFTLHQEEQQQQQIIEVETEPEIVTEIEPEQPEQQQRGDCEDLLSYTYNNNHKQSCNGKWLRRSSSMSSNKIKKIQKRCTYVDSEYDSNHQEATVADYCPSVCKEECRAGLDFDYAVVLKSNQKLTESNVYTSSPNEKYKVGIQDLNSEDNEGGKLVILKKRKRKHKEKPPKVVWSVLQKYTLYDDVTNITSLSMQRDGNLVARNNDTIGNVVWKTSTHHFPGSTLNIDNNGQLFILYRHDYDVENEEEDMEFVPVYNDEQEMGIDIEIEDEEDGMSIRRRTLINSSTNNTKVLETKVWIDGLPPKQSDSSTTNTASITNLEFPVRGIFYYPWFPATWKVGNGSVVFYEPNLLQLQGKYKSSDPRIVENHIQALKYGNMDLGIISWWGQGEHNDKAKIQQLLDETKKQQQNQEQDSVSSNNKLLKWTVYYEDEYKLDNSVEDLVAELNYLQKWYAWQHEVWAYKDNKPVIFVWNEPHECEVMDRWVEAGKIAGWYVVLKLFSDHDTICDAQPDSWHQYGVSPSGPIDNREWSYTIGPGFWHAKEPEKPRVPRASQTTFCDWVTTMQSRINTDWHLIVSFNEWGEGTSVESATAWESDSGYGIYLDCLHDPIKYGGSSVVTVDNNNNNYKTTKSRK